jgi:hypothetical protein
MKAVIAEFAANGFRTARLLPCSRKNFGPHLTILQLSINQETGDNLSRHAGE